MTPKQSPEKWTQHEKSNGDFFFMKANLSDKNYDSTGSIPKSLIEQLQSEAREKAFKEIAINKAYETELHNKIVEEARLKCIDCRDPFVESIEVLMGDKFQSIICKCGKRILVNEARQGVMVRDYQSAMFKLAEATDVARADERKKYDELYSKYERHSKFVESLESYTDNFTDFCDCCRDKNDSEDECEEDCMSVKMQKDFERLEQPVQNLNDSYDSVSKRNVTVEEKCEHGNYHKASCSRCNDKEDSK